ncbi:MAG: hypothetical protein JJU06_09525 [Ectothiorhodospiraceae bacterium]|nr:hypothetical protein [Ectothiorhodospiraceae bacterium]MCH8503134.1 hypothetical protein [Ectothiorhodospiraceae bacterium]
MNTRELYRQLLAIGDPWRVRRLEINVRDKRLDIWVEHVAGSTGGFLSRALGKKSAGFDRERVWRHLNVGRYRAFVHSEAAPSGVEPFLGEEGIPFTNAMAARVSSLLAVGTCYRAICTAMDLDFEDVWQLKAARYRGADTNDTAPDAGNELVAWTSGGLPPIPDVSDPVWERMLAGDHNSRIKILSLRLLLSQTQIQLRNVDDPSLRQQKIHKLRRYFINNARALRPEMQRIFDDVRV